jgi:hypothetical protein
MSELQNLIETAFEARASIDIKANNTDLKNAVEKTIAGLSLSLRLFS